MSRESDAEARRADERHRRQRLEEARQPGRPLSRPGDEPFIDYAAAARDLLEQAGIGTTAGYTAALVYAVLGLCQRLEGDR